MADVVVREAEASDHEFVVRLMEDTLGPFYGGDHRAHAERIFSAHVGGGKDLVGHFSQDQKMFVMTVDGERAGMLHLVGKRQQTYKISPLIVVPAQRGVSGFGTRLLEFAENYADSKRARQIYCTVATANTGALQFFLAHGYTKAGQSPSQYKDGIAEVMLYKPLDDRSLRRDLDRLNLSVVPFAESHEQQVRALLLERLPEFFDGIDDGWVDALLAGYRRRETRDVNQKFKLIFVVVDRAQTVLGVAGATPKKGEPIKIMPLIATTPPAFIALLTDVPFLLREYGRKLYVHITPSVVETIALQRRGWTIDGLMPGAYNNSQVTQQWSFDMKARNAQRHMRVKKRFLDAIKRGAKTLEVRVGYDSIRSIQPGESIVLSSVNEEETIRISAVRTYPSFEQMVQVEDPSRISPGADAQAVLELLREIYPPDREALGVYVLEIEQPIGLSVPGTR